MVRPIRRRAIYAAVIEDAIHVSRGGRGDRRLLAIDERFAGAVGRPLDASAPAVNDSPLRPERFETLQRYESRGRPTVLGTRSGGPSTPSLGRS